MNMTITNGRLVAEPKLLTSVNGKAYTNITIADNYFANGENQVDYVPYTFFGKNAENICKYLTKGSEVLAQGKLKTRVKKDESTNKNIYSLQAIGLKIKFIGAVKGKEQIAEVEDYNIDNTFDEVVY
jgi:single-strand DNA-binding protein